MEKKMISHILPLLVWTLKLFCVVRTLGWALWDYNVNVQLLPCLSLPNTHKYWQEPYWDIVNPKIHHLEVPDPVPHLPSESFKDIW